MISSEASVVTARRSYEFHPDNLRLAAIAAPLVQTQLRAALGFQSSGVGPPMPTFGPVTVAQPAGVVFDWGGYLTEEGVLIPIRFLHFEATRVVLDVLGESSAIDTVYAIVISTLKSVALGMGEPILGESAQRYDYSELTLSSSFDLIELLRPQVGQLLTSQATKDIIGGVLVPSYIFQAVPGETAYQGALGLQQYVLQARAGKRPGEHVLFSGAPLATDAHAEYLRSLSSSLMDTDV